MNTSLIKNRAIELEAKLDLNLFGVYRGADGKYYKEDGTEAKGAGDFKSVSGAVRAVAVGAAAGGAALGGSALAKRYGADSIVGPKKALLAVGRGVGRDVSEAAKSGARASLKPVAGILENASSRANRVAGVARDSGRKTRGLRRTLGLIGRAAVRPVGFSEVVKARLIELAERE